MPPAENKVEAHTDAAATSTPRNRRWTGANFWRLAGGPNCSDDAAARISLARRFGRRDGGGWVAGAASLLRCAGRRDPRPINRDAGQAFPEACQSIEPAHESVSACSSAATVIYSRPVRGNPRVYFRPPDTDQIRVCTNSMHCTHVGIVGHVADGSRMVGCQMVNGALHTVIALVVACRGSSTVSRCNGMHASSTSETRLWDGNDEQQAAASPSRALSLGCQGPG